MCSDCIAGAVHAPNSRMRLVPHIRQAGRVGPAAKRRVFVGSVPGAFSLTSSFDTDCRPVGRLLVWLHPSGRHDISKRPDYLDPNHNKERSGEQGTYSSFRNSLQRTREIIRHVLLRNHIRSPNLHLNASASVYPGRAPLMDREGNREGVSNAIMKGHGPCRGRGRKRRSKADR